MMVAIMEEEEGEEEEGDEEEEELDRIGGSKASVQFIGGVRQRAPMGRCEIEQKVE